MRSTSSSFSPIDRTQRLTANPPRPGSPPRVPRLLSALIVAGLIIGGALFRPLPVVVMASEADGGTFTSLTYLKALNAGAGDQLGRSVAVSGNTVVVGAISEDSNGMEPDPASDNSAASAGAVYVFVRTGAGWIQQAYLKASNAGSDDEFGYAVAISGDTIVVGANQEDGSGVGVDPASDEAASNSGAAYVFVRNGNTWSQQAYLKASNAGANDGFGWSVVVAGDTLVVGARFEDGGGTGVDPASNEGATDAGAAYVFVRSGSTWSQQAYLKATNTGADDSFGYSVALDGDTAVVGAVFEDGGSPGINPPSNELQPFAGAAYAFSRTGSTWSPGAYLKASNPQSIDQFGYSMVLSGDTVVIGAPEESGSGTGVNPVPNESSPSAGAAYVFVLSGGTWSQQAYLKATNTGPPGRDWFGYSVGLSENTIVVGASFEDGSGTGVDPLSDEAALSSGAAYVFVRSGTLWSPSAYLKASNTGSLDLFGVSIAVSGSTVVVGSQFEDGSGTGIDPTSDEDAPDAGAAYVYTASTVPGAPAIDSVTPGDGQLTLAFTAGDTGGEAITTYEYSTDDGSTFTEVSPATTTSPIVIGGLANGTEYTIRIRAVNSLGAGAASASVSGTPSALPGAPTITDMTAGDGQLSVAFSAGGSGGSPLSNYEYSTDDGATFTPVMPSSTSSPIVISGLTNGTTYTVRIRAVNDYGSGAASEPSLGTPSTTPGATIITRVAPGDGQLTVTFKPAATGGSAITNYEYVVSGPGGSPNAPLIYTPVSPASTTSPIVITGLTNGVLYSVRVRAVNANGAGRASAPVAGTPDSKNKGM